MTPKAKSIIRPLYIWTFIESLIFWYAIEKLLWSSAGMTGSQIIILGMIAQSSQILIEVPSSIIADRWSRRKSLILSSIFMLVSVSIVLVVQSFYSFAIMSLFWAFYFAFQSGTTNAYAYDLLKEAGEQSQYRKAISRLYTYQLLGLLVSSLIASLLIKAGNFLTPYWSTLLPSAIAILLLWRMHDPVMERTEQSMGTALHHARSAARNIYKKKWIIIVFVALALSISGRYIWYEYYQLYSIEQNVPAVLFGLILALIHIGNILGSEFAHRVRNPSRVLAISLGVLVVSTASLAFISGLYAIILFLMASFFGSQAASIILDENLQHETASELRATTLSLANLLSRILFAIAAVVILIIGVSPKIIALVSLAIFIGISIYYPIRKHLVLITKQPTL